MKKQRGLIWKLGLFIVVGLVLLVVGLFFVGKQKNLFASAFHLKTIFNNVNGLKVGNTVRFGGIAVGTVDGIRLLNDTSVQVNMNIKSEVRKFIRQDASAGIGTDGLVGDRLVIISPGTPDCDPVKDNDVLISRSPVETEEILAGLKTSVDNAAIITQQLAEVSYKVNHGHGIISRLIGDSSMGNNLHATMVNLKNGSAGLNEDVEAAKHNFLLKGYFKKKKKKKIKRKKNWKSSKRMPMKRNSSK